MQTTAREAARAAGVTVGGLGVVVLVAIGLGALATRLAPATAMFAVALGVTASAALLGGLATGPVLYRLSHRPSADVIAPGGRAGPLTDDGPASTA